MAGIRMYDLSLPNLRDLAVETLDLWDKAETKEDRTRLHATLEEIISQYTADSKAACYRAAVLSGDPMKYACDTYFFDVIRIKETKDKDTGDVVRTIEDAQKPIDLGNLNDKTKGGIGANHLWKAKIEGFNESLTIRADDRLGDGSLKELLLKYPDAYRLSEAAKALRKGELTEESLIEDIDEILKFMIGPEYSADDKDLHHVEDNYIRIDRKSKTNLNAASHRQLIEVFKMMCYRHINHLPSYKVVTRELKKQ